MKAQRMSSYPHGVGAFENRLIVLVKLWKDKKASLDDVAREFYQCQRVRRIAWHVSRKAGMDSPVDEAVHLVGDRFFTEGIMDSIYDEENLFSLIYRVAQNAIRQEAESNLRWNKKHEQVHENGPSIEDLRIVEDFSNDVLRKINRQRSSEELMRRLETKSKKTDMNDHIVLRLPLTKIHQSIEIASGNQEVVRPKVISVPGDQQKEKVLSAEAQELRDIRKRLGYRVEDLARAINVSRDTISAALYGRMNPITDEIMQSARDLLESSMAEISKREAKFSRYKDMNELVQAWLKELELEDNRKGEEQLAVVLRVFHSTLFRWRKAAYKPQLNDLERYDQNVRIAAEHRKKLRQVTGAQETVKPKRKSAGSRKSASSS